MRKLSKEMLNYMFNNHALIKDALPTERQVQLIRFVNGGSEVTGPEVAKHFEITLSGASAQLKALCGKGFLSRVDVGDPTGGNLFQYTCAINIKDSCAPSE